MHYVWIGLGIAAFLALAVLAIAYVCFRIAFYAPKRKEANKEEFPLPKGSVYDPFRDTMISWMKEVRAMPFEAVSVRSFDGLTLNGKYYEYAPGAPIELMFHGYRGNAERDLCGGIQRCFALGRSILLVDQRASEGSDGTVISFGIHESRDCHTWIRFMLQKFGPDVKIILTGISMGAATVLTAAGKELPPNVIGVLADCGFTSARDIIQEVIGRMKLPAKVAYPLVRLGARIFGGFDPDAASALEAMGHCRVPVIFFHGESDDYVPCDMSRRMFEACAAPKKLVTIPGAGHGLSYLVDPDRYLRELDDFFKPYL